MIGIHSRMSLDEIQLLLVLSTFWFFVLSGIVYQNLLQQQWRQPVSISSFFLLRIPQAANARDPLHTTKASLLHRQNSNARVTKAEKLLQPQNTGKRRRPATRPSSPALTTPRVLTKFSMRWDSHSPFRFYEPAWVGQENPSSSDRCLFIYLYIFKKFIYKFLMSHLRGLCFQ